ncbi:MAG: Wzz/FepE/Etk N-terminal domain-containing protein [Nitrospirota bacterium]
MSRLLDTPQVVMTPSRGHGANLPSRDGMVPQDLLSVVSRRRGLVATIIVASLLSAFAVSALLLPKAYESTATLLPQLDSKEGGSLAALLATTGAGGMAQNLGVGLPSMPTTPTDVFVAILKSRVMADEAIAKFGLMAVYHERTMHDTRVELAERVRVTVSKEKVIKVTVEDADPQRAADIAAYFVSSLDRLNRTLNVSKASYNRAFIERRLTETQTGLVKTEEALRDFQRNNKAVAVEAQSKAMIEAAAMIQGQITGYEVQLQVMSAYLSPDNPDLSRVRSSIEELKKQLALLEFGKGAKGASPGDRLHPAMVAVPDLALQYGRLFRELKVQETLYALLTSQYEQAKITEARDTPTVQVLDPPVPADKQIKPRVVFNTAVAGLLGACLAIILAYGLEARARRNAGLPG